MAVPGKIAMAAGVVAYAVLGCLQTGRRAKLGLTNAAVVAADDSEIACWTPVAPTASGQITCAAVAVFAGLTWTLGWRAR
jgi:hypothetical protein